MLKYFSVYSSFQQSNAFAKIYTEKMHDEAHTWAAKLPNSSQESSTTEIISFCNSSLSKMLLISPNTSLQ